MQPRSAARPVRRCSVLFGPLGRIVLLLAVLQGGLVRAQTTVHVQDFSAGLGGWQSVNVLDATSVWAVAGGVAEINGAGGTADEDWLISPAINMNTQGTEFLLFDYFDSNAGALLQVFYSVNYSGAGTAAAVGAATWTALPLELVDLNVNACGSTVYQRHPAIPVSAISGTAVRFAFKYTGLTTAAKYYRVDNVRILSGYYDGVETARASGIYCAALKTRLHSLTSRQSDRIRYTSSLYDVWDAFYHTDERRNDANSATIVWDMFTDKPSTTGEFEFDLCTDRDNGTCSGGEGVCYNREHTFPTSWWGGGTTLSDTQYVDLHHLAPSDKVLNAVKNNYPPGKVLSVTTAGTNGWKMGSNNSYPCGSSMRYFEPIDTYKGDYARMFMYLAVRYENRMVAWAPLNSIGDCAMNGNAYTAYEPWLLSLLSQWHMNDPVSQKEIDRNNAVYAIQGNRNPFIDHPEYAGYIWEDYVGNPCGPPVVLPIELLTFEAYRAAGGVRLDWATASERDNTLFRVERSVDLEHWQEVAQLLGAGNSVSQIDYTAYDPAPLMGTAYYRLAQVDANGRTTHSMVRAVTIDDPGPMRLNAYPTPTDGLLMVVSNEALDPTTVQVIGMDGRDHSGLVRTDSRSARSVQLDLGRLGAGLYVVRAGKGSVRVQKY